MAAGPTCGSLQSAVARSPTKLWFGHMRHSLRLSWRNVVGRKRLRDTPKRKYSACKLLSRPSASCPPRCSVLSTDCSYCNRGRLRQNTQLECLCRDLSSITAWSCLTPNSLVRTNAASSLSLSEFCLTFHRSERQIHTIFLRALICPESTTSQRHGRLR